MKLRSSVMIPPLFCLLLSLKPNEGVSSPTAMRDVCKQIVLFDGGFTGEICNLCNTTIMSTILQQLIVRSKSAASAAVNVSTCFLSFDTKSNASTDKTFSFSDSGVWLLKNADDGTFQIKIARKTNLKPNNLVCFVRRSQTCNKTSEFLGSPAHSENVTCVDPKTVCVGAKYSPNCVAEEGSNIDIVNITDASPKCYKCGTAFQETEGNVRIPNITMPNKEPNSNTSYTDVIKNLNKMVLQLMENKSSVSVSLDDVEGIFVKQEKVEPLIPLHFMFSNQTNFMIIEDKTQMLNFDKTFSISKEAFEKASNLSMDILFVSLLQFTSFPQDHETSTLLNDEVYSINMGAEISNINDTFNLTFNNIRSNYSTPVCSSWDGRGVSPNWTTDGCNTSLIHGSVTCLCHHLTFFAVLMTNTPKNISTSDLNSLTYLTSIGCGMSLFLLSIGLFMHFLLRRGQASVSVHILINLFLALFLLNLCFLVNESVANAKSDVGCKLIAGMMHYFMLSAFTWFGLQALHLCLHLTLNVASIQNYIIKLCVTGWAPPAVVVAAIFPFQKYNRVSIVSDTGKRVQMCWITDPIVHYAVNICYYFAIFLFTFFTFVVMLRWLYLLRRKSPISKFSAAKVRPSDALTIMGLCCILGLSWGFALFAYGPLQIPAYYIFSILNSCQGIFLFIYYYNSSRLVGGDETLVEESSSSTVVENPYHNRKSF